MDTITFEQAVELLGIVDISTVRVEDLRSLERRARARWHPDRIVSRGKTEDVARYTQKFQDIDRAIELVRQFLDGSLAAGARSRNGADSVRPPEEVIRQNAPAILERLRSIWPRVRSGRYKWSQETVHLSDGFRLRDLIDHDWNDDIAAQSLISFAYGAAIFGASSAIAMAVSPVLGVLASLFCLVQAASCMLGVLPLSRYWLSEQLQRPMLWFVNLGFGMYQWSERESRGSDKVWLHFLIHSPLVLATVAKYLVIWPAYALAKAIAGDRVVGIVTKAVDYYGGFAEWYIERLLSKDPGALSVDELIDLGRLYSAIGDLR